jgi:hypothetical protein
MSSFKGQIGLIFHIELVKPNCLYAQKKHLVKNNNSAYFWECFIKKHEQSKVKVFLTLNYIIAYFKKI